MSGHVQEIDFTLEEDFLDMLLRMMRDLPLADIYQSGQQPTMAKQLISGEAEAGTRALSVRLWRMQVSSLSCVGPPSRPLLPSNGAVKRVQSSACLGPTLKRFCWARLGLPWSWPVQCCLASLAVMAAKALGILAPLRLMLRVLIHRNKAELEVETLCMLPSFEMPTLLSLQDLFDASLSAPSSRGTQRRGRKW